MYKQFLVQNLKEIFIHRPIYSPILIVLVAAIVLWIHGVGLQLFSIKPIKYFLDEVANLPKAPRFLEASRLLLVHYE